jgi:hypothetical protein
MRWLSRLMATVSRPQNLTEYILQTCDTTHTLPTPPLLITLYNYLFDRPSHTLSPPSPPHPPTALINDAMGTSHKLPSFSDNFRYVTSVLRPPSQKRKRQPRCKQTSAVQNMHHKGYMHECMNIVWLRIKPLACLCCTHFLAWLCVNAFAMACMSIWMLCVRMLDS